MQYELVITADTNDADYVTATHKVTEEDIEKLKPIIEVIKGPNPKRNYRSHNWPTGDIGNADKEYEDLLTEDQIEWFNDLVPFGEYGIHTIESVVYYPLPEKTVLL